MASSKRGIPVEVLRLAAQAYVAEVTLRPAAEAIGMSTSGLHSFLQGTTPHPTTVRKLTTWYFRRVAESAVLPSAELVSAALDVLVEPLPSSRQETVRRELLEVLVRRCEETGVPTPSWLTELRTREPEESPHELATDE